MKEIVDHGDLDATLDVIAAWLIAAYGGRIERTSLWLEGYYGPVSECYGITPVTLDRGVRPEAGEETRETLPWRARSATTQRRSSRGSAPEYSSFGSQAATSARSPVRTS